MAHSKRTAVERYHDRVAGIYDHSYDDAYWKWHDALTWDYLKPFLPRSANASVADLGCGTGKWGARLAKSGFEVTCVDISSKMLDQARRKVTEVAGSTVAHFVHADLCDLSGMAESTFSLAIAFGDAIGCTSSPTKAVKQIRRLLVEGGLLVATFDSRLAGIDHYLRSGDREALTRFLRDGKTHWLTKRVEEQFPILTFQAADINRLAESNRMEVVDVVGKTVLPMRHYRDLLESSEDRRKWAKVEKSLSRDPSAIGRASHFQATFRAL